MKRLLVAVLLVACGNKSKLTDSGDKCERSSDKLAALLKMDRAKMVAACQDDLKLHPESEKMLDCVLDIPGEITRVQMRDCAKRFGRQVTRMTDADALVHMTQLKDAICACTDKACTDKVNAENVKWVQGQTAAGIQPPAMSKENADKATAIGVEMGKCMQRALGIK